MSRPSPLENRVDPYGARHAVADRGLFWGNRGCIHEDDGRFVRDYRGRGWVICQLDFHGRHRTLLQPGRLSELFFLDEATALSAGHRPCGECRSTAYRAFREAFCAGNGSSDLRAREIDAMLHSDRREAPGRPRTYRADPRELPPGTFVEHDGAPVLLWEGSPWRWTHAGYEAAGSLTAKEVRVLTPRSTVAALAAGYRPVVHPSAGRRGGSESVSRAR